MSGTNSEIDSVEEVSEEVSEETPKTEEKSVEEKESATESLFREDPFASLNMPPPIGDDYEDSEDYSEERGPAISALDANSRKKEPKESKLSEKSESFLSSLGIGFDEEEEEKQPMPSLSTSNIPSLFGEFGDDDDLGGLNDPLTTQLDQPPLLGGKISTSPGMQGILGRATTPKLFAQASQFPTCTQLKCFKWENGVPVSIGAIDSQADEADFIREFFETMPEKGDGKIRYSFRPIDMNGEELGSEVAFFISDNHKEVLKLRKKREEDSEDDSGDGFGGIFANRRGRGRHEGDNMWNRMVNDTRQQTEHLRSSLQEDRDRLRRMEEERAQERVDLAVNTAQGVQALSNQMLEAEQYRAQLSMKQQQQQTDVMMNSLSSIFSQQQSMTQLQMQRQQQADQMRVEQERMRAERERIDLEERRRRDREEYEERRNRESREMELKWKEMEEQRRWEREQTRIQLEKEKHEYDQKRTDEQRKWEREMEMNRLRVEQEKLENERKIAREREELLLKLKMDREDLERRDNQRREEREREEERRKEDMLLRQQQLNIQAQRDKEHQERLMQMSISERDQQRDSMERKALMEKEMRDAEERERQRRHEMMMKELEQTRQRDREHSERMFMLQQKEIDVKGMGGLDSLLPKASSFLTQFGLEPVDVLRSVLGQGEVGDDGEPGDSSAGWMDNLPKILGLVGDVMKVATSGQAALPQSQPVPMIAQDAELQNLMYQQQMVQEQMMRQQQTMAGGSANFDQFYPPPQQATQQASAQPTQPTEPVVVEPSTSELAEQAGMSLNDQRNARKALRKLVKNMRGAKREKWENLVTEALISEIGIFSYIVAVNAKVAISEAGADPTLCSEIVQALKNSQKLKETLEAFSMSINDIPFGE